MIKINTGEYVKPCDSDVKKYIILKSHLPCDWKAFVAGIGSIIIGVTILTIGSFKHGAKKYVKAELEALESLDLAHRIEKE